MAYCQLIRYSKSPKQREQRSRQLMLSPVRVYVCHTKWWQLHTQAGVKEVFSFCLSRLAMPEWWGRTIWMPRFCVWLIESISLWQTIIVNTVDIDSLTYDNLSAPPAPAIPTEVTEAATNSTKVQGNPNTPANTAVTPSHLSCKW